MSDDVFKKADRFATMVDALRRSLASNRADIEKLHREIDAVRREVERKERAIMGRVAFPSDWTAVATTEAPPLIQ